MRPSVPGSRAGPASGDRGFSDPVRASLVDPAPGWSSQAGDVLPGLRRSKALLREPRSAKGDGEPGASFKGRVTMHPGDHAFVIATSGVFADLKPECTRR